MSRSTPSLSQRLLQNSRFWILVAGIIGSVNIAGLIQLFINGHDLQIIRTEQLYGFICLALLYIALLASPLTKVFPRLPFKVAYLHARRAIGVLAFYYALLHVLISFFGQLGGFAGLGHFDGKYETSLLLGIVGLGILFAMAATSLDWAIKTMGFKNWKRLQQFVYLATVAILIHVVLIGTHYSKYSPVFIMTAALLLVLIVLEATRIYRTRQSKKESS